MSEAIADFIAPAVEPAADADESGYILNSRIEILHVLRDLVRMHALATVHLDGDRDTLLTPLLAVDAAAGEITFDCSENQALNRNVLQAGKLLFLSSQYKVKIRFSTAPARMVERDGREAFAVPVPETMLRLQRREFYRVLAPVAGPVKCILLVGSADSYRYVEARLHDIGQGGVSIIVQPGELLTKFGTRYANCRIVLPEVGNVVATLDVRQSVAMTLLNGKSVVRVGLQFLRPSTTALSLVQRYMMALERDRRAKE